MAAKNPASRPRYVGIELRFGPNTEFFQYLDGRGKTAKYRKPKIQKSATSYVEFTSQVFGKGPTHGAPFSVHFKGLSPFEKGRYGSAGAPIQAHFRPDAQGGTYQYFVAVYEADRIWTDDPEIIVW